VGIVISALHFAWQDAADCLGIATGEFGLDGVELSWHESFTHAHSTREDLGALASLTDRPRVAVSAHIWDNLAEADNGTARESLLRWLGVCRQTGVRNLVVHGGSWPDRKDGIARVRRVLEPVLPSFERAGVVLNLENHYAYTYRNGRELFSEPWEFLEVFSLDSPSLKFCFDTGHGNMTHNTAELLDALGPWLNYVHLADNHGVDDDHVPYGEGTVDWAGVFSHLEAARFDGTFCVEFPVREERAPFRACVAEIRRRWGGQRG